MRTPFQLHLEFDILAALKAYAAEQRVSVTRVIAECLCQFLGLKGLLDPVLKAAVEERIQRTAGRPMDPDKKAKREALAAEEQARVYAAAGVDPRAAEAGVTEPGPLEGEERNDVFEGSGDHIPETQPDDDETFGVVPDDMPLPEDRVPDTPPGPPIFKPSNLDPPPDQVDKIINKSTSSPSKICLRCMEVVGKCQCEEGPDEG